MMNEERLMRKYKYGYMHSKALLGDAYVQDMQKRIDQLERQNNDLRRIYKNTRKKLEENGKEELASYFSAQIDECPTFYVEPVIDYEKEYKFYKGIVDDAKSYVRNYTAQYYTEDLEHRTVHFVDAEPLAEILEGR